MANEGTHKTHCCKEHGCKYGERACPVLLGLIKQDHPCETCSWAAREVEELLETALDTADDTSIVAQTFIEGLRKRGLKLVKIDD